MPKRKLNEFQAEVKENVKRHISENVKDGDTVLIVREEVDGVKLLFCPFCDLPPVSSDIKFRKHLKQFHPTKKTFITDSHKKPKVTEETELSDELLRQSLDESMLGIALHSTKVCFFQPVIKLNFIELYCGVCRTLMENP